jgi:hypothetical protein
MTEANKIALAHSVDQLRLLGVKVSAACQLGEFGTALALVDEIAKHLAIVRSGLEKARSESAT